MSDKELWAVYLDYALRSEVQYGHDATASPKVHTVPLGGFIAGRRDVLDDLAVMAGNIRGYDHERGIWEVDEDDLPYGYTFQTYYVARYFPEGE